MIKYNFHSFDVKELEIMKKKDTLWKNSIDMMYLISCILNDIKAEGEIVENLDLNQLYYTASNQTLAAITSMALEMANVFDSYKDVNIVKSWTDSKNKAIRKNLLLDVERKEICKFCEENSIWYMPLKGVFIKELYPRAGMRQMADNDILYDKEYQNKIYKFMKNRGYKPDGVGRGNHDVYEKAPVYNFEMHRELFERGINKTWTTYYENIKLKLIKDNNKEYGYHFKEEDFYIYILTHAYKHYKEKGTGIRTLVDIYVFLKKCENIMDWDYIKNDLYLLGISDFEHKCRILSGKIFSEGINTITKLELEELYKFISVGTYGTLENSIGKKLQKSNDKITLESKNKYFKERLFPSDEWYKNAAPFAYKNKWFRPAFIVFRAFRGVFKNGKKINKEIKIVLHSNNRKKS